jgi:hypothetical protein
MFGREEVERDLSVMMGRDVDLPEGVVGFGAPETCPACGSQSVIWAVDSTEGREVHPLIWHETQRLADSWLCEACNAGWIEAAGDPKQITWVRPWWLASERAD